MSKVWFICFTITTNNKITTKRVLIPQKLDKSGRLDWARGCIEKYENKRDALKRRIKESEACFNNTIVLLYAALARKTRLSNKTVSTFKGHIKGINLYCQKFDLKTIENKDARNFIFYL